MEQKKDKLWVLWVHTFYIKSQNLETMAIPKQASWMNRKIFDVRKWIRGKAPLQSIKDDRLTTNTYNIKKGICITVYDGSISKSWMEKLIMMKGIIPRHQFILWLALQRKMSTVDRVIKWGIGVQIDCVLCRFQVEENFDNLFFQYPYSMHMWDRLLKWIGVTRNVMNWDQEILWLMQYKE